MLHRLAPFCLLALLTLNSTGRTAVAPPGTEAPARVGQLIIVGNDRTRTDVILRRIGLSPGRTLTYLDLVQAEKILNQLKIFQGGENKPRVAVIDNPADRDNPFKDFLITVHEANTGSLMFGLGVNDLFNGNAFRGAGQELRLVLSCSQAGGLHASGSLGSSAPVWDTFAGKLTLNNLPLMLDLVRLPLGGPSGEVSEVIFRVWSSVLP
jgi:outer membrane protein assembly factor BamA